jgi:hypothetical protein
MKRMVLLVVLASVAVTAMSSEDDAIVREVLNRLYDGYDRTNACWVARSADDPGRADCLTIDRVDRVEADTGSRLYVLLTGRAFDPRTGENIDSHVTRGLVGALVIGFGPDGVELIAGEPRLSSGDWGVAPTDWSLIKLAPSDYWGWVNRDGFLGQGIHIESYSILAPHGRRIRDLGPIHAAWNNVGACGEAGEICPVTDIDSTLEVDSINIGATVFPLRITLTGQFEGRKLTPKTWDVPFDQASWSYVEPVDWPLAELDR